MNTNNISYADHYIKSITNLCNDLSSNVQSTYISGSLNKTIPILLVKIYSSIPYFMRSYLVNDYTWKHNNYQEWITHIVGTEISVKETAKATLTIIVSEYTHSFWKSKNSPITYKNTHTINDVETMFYHNTKDTFQYISFTSKITKRKCLC